MRGENKLCKLRAYGSALQFLFMAFLYHIRLVLCQGKVLSSGL